MAASVLRTISVQNVRNSVKNLMTAQMDTTIAILKLEIKFVVRDGPAITVLIEKSPIILTKTARQALHVRMMVIVLINRAVVVQVIPENTVKPNNLRV